MGTRIPVTGGLCKEDVQGSLGTCPERGDVSRRSPREALQQGARQPLSHRKPPRFSAWLAYASLQPLFQGRQPQKALASVRVPCSVPSTPGTVVCVCPCYLLPHRPPVQNRAEQICHALAPTALLQRFPSQQRPPHTHFTPPSPGHPATQQPKTSFQGHRVAGLSPGITLPTTNAPAALCSLHLQMQVPLLFGE